MPKYPLLMALLLAAGVAQAQPRWHELSPEQQQQFARWADRWDELPADKRARIMANHARWQAMSPEERGEARERWSKFKSLPPDQREALRACYQRKRAGEDVECPKPGGQGGR